MKTKYIRKMMANDIETAKAMREAARRIRAVTKRMSPKTQAKTSPRTSWPRSRAFLCGAATALKVIKIVELAKYELLLREIRRAICRK